MTMMVMTIIMTTMMMVTTVVVTIVLHHAHANVHLFVLVRIVMILVTIMNNRMIHTVRFFYNAYFQNKKVDRNGSSKQGVEVTNLKEGKASNGALAKVDQKEKVQ